MKLLFYELRKVWANRVFLVCLIGVLAANLFLIWAGTSTGQNVPPGAYKGIAKDLDGLPTEQQQEFVQEKIDLVSALLNIESYYQYGDASARPGPEMQQLLNEYGDTYLQKTYTLYTDNLRQEYQFLSQILAEIVAVGNYDGFLADVQTQAQTLANISIFATQDSYDMKTIKTTAFAYRNLENVTIQYSPQKGFYTVVHFLFTDVFLVFSILLLAGILVRSERDNGLLKLLRTTPKGRLHTSLAKLGALAISVFAVLLLLYGVNLVYCHGAFGLGALSRSVQSLPFLLRCTLPLTVGQYLFLFLLAKWVAAFVVGCVVCTVVLCAKKVFWGWCGTLVFLGINFMARLLVPATSHWNVVKYANLISLLNTNELLGVYRNLYWFGAPVGLPTVVWCAAGVFAAVFISVFVITFCKSSLQNQQANIVLLKFKQRHTSIFREEAHKVFVLGGAVFFLVAACGFSLWQAASTQSYIDGNEIYYRYYMQNLTGPYTAEKRLWLQQEYEEFAPVTELERAFLQGEISQQEYELGRGQHYGLIQRKAVFDTMVRPKIDYVANTAGTHLVYETGYAILFDFKNETDIVDTLMAGLLISLCFPSFFAIEKQSGMFALMQTTPLGKRFVVKRKMQIALFISAAITTLTCLPHYWQILRDYGFGGLFSPARSMSHYAALPAFISLFGLMLLSFIFKWLACLCMGFITMALSLKTGNIFATTAVSAVLFCSMPLLSLLGVKNVQWFSFYPYFHIAQICSQPYGLLFAVLLLMVLGLVLAYCVYIFFPAETAP